MLWHLKLNIKFRVLKYRTVAWESICIHEILRTATYIKVFLCFVDPRMCAQIQCSSVRFKLSAPQVSTAKFSTNVTVKPYPWNRQWRPIGL
jgi:hypothetical protein